MGYRIAILTTTINPATIRAMVQSARAETAQAKVEIVVIKKTLGCLDMPIVAKKLFEQDDVDGVVVLGAVAKGDTKHDELVVNVMTNHIVALSLQYDKPVSFGVIGPGAMKTQFSARTDEYARRAVRAVIQSYLTLGPSPRGRGKKSKTSPSPIRRRG